MELGYDVVLTLHVLATLAQFAETFQSINYVQLVILRVFVVVAYCLCVLVEVVDPLLLGGHFFLSVLAELYNLFEPGVHQRIDFLGTFFSLCWCSVEVEEEAIILVFQEVVHPGRVIPTLSSEAKARAIEDTCLLMVQE